MSLALIKSGNWRLLWKVLLAAALVCVNLPAEAAISSADLVKAIEKAKILSSDYKIQATIQGEEAQILTYRNPKATDKDCKIDAVLVARAAMEADSANIKRVKLLFYDTTNANKYRQVVVREGDVKAFAARALSPDELLESIDITTDDTENPAAHLGGKNYSDITQSPGVIDGPQKGERMELLGRIETLKEKGVGVQPFVAQFLRIEDRVRMVDTNGLPEAINSLNDKLNEQEQRYGEAHVQHSQQAQIYAGSSQAQPVPARGGQYSGQGGNPAGPGGPQGPGGPNRSPAAFKEMVDLVHRQLGDEAPRAGPFFLRRCRLALKVRDLQNQGQNVDQYKQQLKQIEDLAATYQTAELNRTIRETERQLRVGPAGE